MSSELAAWEAVKARVLDALTETPQSAEQIATVMKLRQYTDRLEHKCWQLVGEGEAVAVPITVLCPECQHPTTTEFRFARRGAVRVAGVLSR